MKFGVLVPAPTSVDAFMRHRVRFVPDAPGCYALTNVNGDVMYVGLAKSLRKRMEDHLDSPAKTRETPTLGRASRFHWCEFPLLQIQQLERTWMNIHIEHEGKLPLLNSVYSPVSV